MVIPDSGDLVFYRNGVESMIHSIDESWSAVDISAGDVSLTLIDCGDGLSLCFISVGHSGSATNTKTPIQWPFSSAKSRLRSPGTSLVQLYREISR